MSIPAPRTRTVLPDRLCLPTSRRILYHYCSAETLLKILSNKTLRFSEITKLNDAEEQIYSKDTILEECLWKLENNIDLPKGVPSLSRDTCSHIRSAWQIISSIWQPFTCCFSIDGDSLSQWRAYANDGTGFAVGFSNSKLSLPAQFLKVSYNKSEQMREMIDAITLICREADPHAIVTGKNIVKSLTMENKDFITAMALLRARSAAFKNPAFREEREIRAVFSHRIVSTTGQPKFSETGGISRSKRLKISEADFYSKSDLIVPYLDLDFSDTNDVIRVVNIGPKCKNSVDDIKLLLATKGFSKVRIGTAGSSYR